MTAPHVLRQRREDALARSEKHAGSIAASNPEVAGQFEALRSVAGRDPVHLETNRLVAQADFLEALDATLNGEETAENSALEARYGAQTAHVLHEAGYASPGEVEASTDEDLLAVDGIGPKRLKEIRGA